MLFLFFYSSKKKMQLKRKYIIFIVYLIKKCKKTAGINSQKIGRARHKWWSVAGSRWSVSGPNADRMTSPQVPLLSHCCPIDVPLLSVL